MGLKLPAFLLFLFALTVADAQTGFFIEAGAGYNFAASKTSCQTQNALSQYWFSKYDPSARSISFGKGAVGFMNFGYAAKNNFVEYSLGFQYQQFPETRVKNIKVKTDTTFIADFVQYNANSLRVVPQVMFKKNISRFKLRPFISFGLPVSFHEVEVTTSTQNLETTTISGRTYYPRWASVGAHIGLGLSRNISSRCQLSFSADYTALNFFPHKIFATGRDNRTGIYSNYSYTKTGDSMKDFDRFLPLACSTIGLKLGIKYFIDKR